MKYQISFFQLFYFLILSVSILLVSACNGAQSVSANKAESLEPKPLIELETFDDFLPWLQRETDTTYVINFWATWCKPCVEELPYFEKAHQELSGQNVKFILVSLDFPHQIERRLKPFITDRQLLPQVIALKDTRSSDWINRVDNRWSGSIPATLIYKAEKRHFHEKQYHSVKELKGDIKAVGSRQ